MQESFSRQQNHAAGLGALFLLIGYEWAAQERRALLPRLEVFMSFQVIFIPHELHFFGRVFPLL